MSNCRIQKNSFECLFLRSLTGKIVPLSMSEFANTPNILQNGGARTMSPQNPQVGDGIASAGYEGVGDARLVEETKQGDRDAFGELVRRYERRLLRVILRFVSDEELARDLAQEAFIRVYEKLEMFDPSRRFGPWLFRVGVNLTLDFLRRKKRRGWLAPFTDSPSERDPDPGVDDPRNELDLREEVLTVLEEIPENYRSVLVLRDLENFSTSEIAAILDRKEPTIRWRLAEARNRFQKLWEKRREE